MSILLSLGTPQPKQAEVARIRKKYVAYGGSRGPGKSWFVRFMSVGLAWKYSGIKILILRRTYKELQNNHIDILRAQLYGYAKYNDSEKRFTFPNKSTITFGYCDADSHVMQYQGAEYDVIFIDEATQFKEEWLRVFPACLRGVNDHPKRIYYTCNPGGVSHGFIRRLFIDRDFREGEDPDDYAFVKALVTDNKILLDSQPDYLTQLEALPYKLRKAWLEGDWTILEGAFFEEWTDDPAHYADRRWTHVIEPFEIPKTWTIFRSFDWGYSRPFAVHWWAVDYDGNLYCILELYGMGREPNEGVKWTNDRLFKEISMTEREHPWLKGKHINGVADPAIWAKESTGISIYDNAAADGVYFDKADNERIPGWMQVHYRLAFDEEGFPRMYFFKNCKHMIRTIPLMMYDKVRVEDLDSDMEDHACVVGNTLIQTGTDGRALHIKDLVDTVGYVIGHDGLPHKYSGCKLTRRGAEVYTVTTDDESRVTATPDHLFLMNDGTWRRLDKLKPGDKLRRVLPCESTSFRKPNKSTTGRSTTNAAATSSAKGNACIELYGRKRMGAKSPRGFMSTILTATGQIINQAILRLSGAMTIYPFTGKNTQKNQANAQTESGTLRRHGTGPRKAGNGIARMQRSNGRTENRLHTNAAIAGKNSNQSTDLRRGQITFAETTASRRIDDPLVSTMFNVDAFTAGTNIQSTSITKNKSTAPRSALRTPDTGLTVKSVDPAGREDVYNMAVESSRSYIANGIVSHNCDSLRYACASRPIKPSVPVPEQPILYDPLNQYKNIRPFRRL